ncbi:ankyrin repeat-containing domain protein [Aspergillus insuetus]
MARIEKQAGDKKYTSICVLSWLSCAMRPLTLLELQYAVTVQAKRAGVNISRLRDSAFIISACTGLVTVNSTIGVAQLVHATAHDYLHQAQTDWASIAHSGIAQTCMEHLSNLKLYSEDMVGNESLSPCLFHEYAAENWGHHARMSSMSLTNDIAGFMAGEDLVTQISRHIIPHEAPEIRDTGMTDMHIAAYFGLHDTLESMILARENLPWYWRVKNRIFGGPLGLDSKDLSGRTALSYAAEKGNPCTVKLLLKKGATADLRDVTGRTPLSWAAGSNNRLALSGLSWHADIEAEDNCGMTPLSWAAANGRFEAVDWLLGEGLTSITKDRSARVFKDLGAAFKFLWAKGQPFLSDDEPSGGTPLIWASSSGHLRVVEYLLGKNPPIEEKDLNGRAALSWAAGNGHLAVVWSLLRQGADPKATDKKKRDALMWAAAHGHPAAALLLLQRAACFMARDVTGRTALSLAAQSGMNAVVHLLLKKDAPADDKDNEGRTPLSWAAEGGHRKTTMTLLHYHAALDHKDNNGRTSLSWSAGSGQVRTVEQLLKVGANLGLPDHIGRNALSWAAGNGQTAMVLFLLDIGDSSFLTATDTSGLTFFLWAARNGHDTIIRLLLDRLEYNLIHTPTKKGETALFLACKYGCTKVVTSFLQKDVFSKHETDNLGRTPLMAAVSEDRFEVAELLLTSSAPVNAMDTNMRTVLHLAAYSGSLRFAKLFLRYGASLEIQDNFGRSPLLAAAEGNNQDIAELLLNCGARVDCQDHDGQSPLHWAVRHNNVSMAQLLLDCGANIWITDKDGLTPEALANRLNNHQGGELWQLLRNSWHQRPRAWLSGTGSLSSINSR